MRFQRHQLWPTIKNKKLSSLSWIADNLKNDLEVNKETKIISLGSCFAREIKEWLIKNNLIT